MKISLKRLKIKLNNEVLLLFFSKYWYYKIEFESFKKPHYAED